MGLNRIAEYPAAMMLSKWAASLAVIVLGIEQRRFVAQFDGPITGRLAQHDEPRVVQGRDDDGDPRLPGRSLVGEQPSPQPAEQEGRLTELISGRHQFGRKIGSFQNTTPDFRMTFAYGVHSPVRTITSLDRVRSLNSSCGTRVTIGSIS